MTFPDPSEKPLADLLSLRGRVAVITGAGRGIGAAVARRLAEAGASLVLGDLDEQSAQDVASSVAAEFGVEARGVGLDVTSSASVGALVAVATEQFGRLDIWVNNAGVFPRAEFLDLTEDLWDRVQQVNARGTYLGARAAAVEMVRAGSRGVIVNVSSIAGVHVGAFAYSAYTASKHSVVGLTKALAAELGPQGIRAVGVAPGVIETAGILETMGRDGGATFRAFSASLPSGRGGVPDDIARAVLFVASDMAAFMSGTTIVVDGGYTASR
ncbi:SDR family oxidoreductase [soil metagenome]